jgi:hypothetical protein
MSTSRTGVAAFDTPANAAEGVRQFAVAAAGGNQSTARSAEITFYQTLRALAIANGISPFIINCALRELKAGGV